MKLLDTTQENKSFPPLNSNVSLTWKDFFDRSVPQEIAESG
jgi:hypothetical protein